MTFGTMETPLALFFTDAPVKIVNHVTVPPTLAVMPKRPQNKCVIQFLGKGIFRLKAPEQNELEVRNDQPEA